MQIIEKPNEQQTYFSNYIPQIVLQKTYSLETYVTLKLSVREEIIIEENYFFDSSGYIYIRDLSSLIDANLTPKTVNHGQYSTVSGLNNTFVIDISSNTGSFKKVSKTGTCIAPNVFQVHDATGVSVGDKLYSINGRVLDDEVVLTGRFLDRWTFSRGLANRGAVADLVFLHLETDERYKLFLKVVKSETLIAENAGKFLNSPLSLCREPKKTVPQAPEFVSVFKRYSNTSLTVKCTLYFERANLTTWETTFTLLTVPESNDDRIITIPVGLQTIQRKTNVALDEIIRYDIWFEGWGGTFASFLVDRNKYSQVNCFLFTNSFGVTESVYTTGSTKENRVAEFSFGNIQAKMKRFNADFYKETEVNSGYITRSQTPLFDDLIKSKEVYIVDQAGNAHEIVITDFNYETFSNNLNKLTFIYRKYHNKHYHNYKELKSVTGVFDSSFDRTFN